MPLRALRQQADQQMSEPSLNVCSHRGCSVSCSVGTGRILSAAFWPMHVKLLVEPILP